MIRVYNFGFDLMLLLNTTYQYLSIIATGTEKLAGFRSLIVMLSICLTILTGLTVAPSLVTIKFIYSEKATKFCENFALLLSYVVSKNL